jgi:hypothetical protein
VSEDLSRPSATDPAAGPTAEPAPEPHPPSLEDDLAVLAFLGGSRQLSTNTTSYVIEVLLQWALFEPTVSPDPMPPPEDGLSHLEVLEQIAARWSGRAQTAAGVAGKLAMGRIGRQLALAVQSERDPQGLSEALWREYVQRMPWLAEPLPPLHYPDGSVL